MKLDQFTFSLVVLAFPGILTFLVLKKIAPQPKSNGLDSFLKIFTYSLFSYLLYALALCAWYALPCTPTSASGAEVLQRIRGLDSKQITSEDILGATLSAVALAVLLSYALTNNWMNSAVRFIGASRRSGDKDIWCYFHNMSESNKNGGWVYVRDHDKDLIYYGAIVGWSEADDGNKEILLTDVLVYRDEPKGTRLLYEVKVVYLNQKPDRISIEVPSLDSNETITETKEHVQPEQPIEINQESSNSTE